MNRNYFLFVVMAALACLILIFFTLWWEIQTPPVKEPILTPPRSPYKAYLFGVGIVEPNSENVSIGAPGNRIVEKIYVDVGSKIRKGDMLVLLKNKDLKADLASKQTIYFAALAKLQRLKAFPRTEDVTAATASLNSAKADYDFAKKQYDMVLNLSDPRAMSQEEKNRREFNLLEAKTKLERTEADVAKIESGTWKPDLEIARYESMQAKADLDRVKAQLNDTEIKSPIDGTVLQLKIHEGEVTPMDSIRPIMVLGNIDPLHLRVSINQLDASDFEPSAPAVAYLYDDAKQQFPLEFVRLEPLLVDKKNLTNELIERVDTKVLEIIYRIKETPTPLYVGEQMDAFIEVTNPKNEGSSSSNKVAYWQRRDRLLRASR